MIFNQSRTTLPSFSLLRLRTSDNFAISRYSWYMFSLSLIVNKPRRANFRDHSATSWYEQFYKSRDTSWRRWEGRVRLSRFRVHPRHWKIATSACGNIRNIAAARATRDGLIDSATSWNGVIKRYRANNEPLSALRSRMAAKVVGVSS